MAKRGASSELTDRNWDQEDEPEEAGEFTKASDDKLKGRHIIHAKRKQPSGGSSAFSGFGGFSFKPTQTSTPLFAGGAFFKTESKIPAEDKKDIEKEPEKLESEEASKDDSKSPTKRRKAETNSSDHGQNGSTPAPDKSNYLSNLKSLNISVLNWIQQHLDKNPYCILTPIFKDYEQHLSEMEEEKDKKMADENGNANLKKEESVKPMEEDKTLLPKTGLTFGMGNLQTIKEPSHTTTGFSGFSFKPSTTSLFASAAPTGAFSFAIGSSNPSSSGGADEAKKDDVYVPPIVETVEHKEEGSLYSKKCKLFYQKEGAWTERGVGFIHLKKNDDIAQLLVRADTTLGNILLNIRLSESLPLSRQGKNNVSLMCIVNPPIPNVPEEKPIPMMIRVKTSEDADELLEKMIEIRT